ncbi:MAG: hypothetical protein AMJ75_02255 [Phycisphaerae bacterium SM1_79]|nr:MAG: hypothetical protein AMJ75_02255 [Phycisphaerae bacterium SM1_79]
MDMTCHLQQNLFLGLGGEKPGVAIYDPNLHLLRRVLSLPAGRSVYAIGISDDGRLLAAGTSSGEMYRLVLEPAAGEYRYKTELLTSSVSAPVLSVCFPDEGTFAVSDIAARCLLLGAGQTEPDRLPTGNRIICALFRLDDGHLAGLSTSGDLLIWNRMESEIIQIVEAPSPPVRLTALVKPVYWSEADRWVWPSRSGVIVFYSWSRNEVRAISAHAGDVYAILAYKNELLTMGIDGSVKFWHAGADEPVGGCRGPGQVISAALWADRQSRNLVLINREGKAGIYSWADDEIEFTEWLNGDNFRCAVGPDMQKVESGLRRQKAMRARELSVQIKDRIARRQMGSELDSRHQQLVQLGYEHVSWALRAEESKFNNDIVSELQCYGKLFELLSETDERIEGSLLRFADLLETLWQPEKAHAIFRHLAQRHADNNDYVESMARVSRYMRILEGSKYIIETDIPLPSLVGAATVLKKAFTGRFVVKNVEAPIHCGVIISADELVKKYVEISGTKPQQQLPKAEQVELWWLSNRTIEQVTTVIFAADESGYFSFLEVGVKFLNAANLQTVLVPVVIFKADKKANNEVSIEQHNRAILRQLQPIDNGDASFNGWLRMVYANVRDSVRQLITRKVAQRDR